MYLLSIRSQSTSIGVVLSCSSWSCCCATNSLCWFLMVFLFFRLRRQNQMDAAPKIAYIIKIVRRAAVVAMATVRSYRHNTGNSNTSFSSCGHASMSISTSPVVAAASIVVGFCVSYSVLASIWRIGVDIFTG